MVNKNEDQPANTGDSSPVTPRPELADGRAAFKYVTSSIGALDPLAVQAVSHRGFWAADLSIWRVMLTPVVYIDVDDYTKQVNIGVVSDSWITRRDPDDVATIELHESTTRLEGEIPIEMVERVVVETDHLISKVEKQEKLWRKYESDMKAIKARVWSGTIMRRGVEVPLTKGQITRRIKKFEELRALHPKYPNRQY